MLKAQAKNTGDIAFKAGKRSGFQEVMLTIRKWQKLGIMPSDEELDKAFYAQLKEWES